MQHQQQQQQPYSSLSSLPSSSSSSSSSSLSFSSSSPMSSSPPIHPSVLASYPPPPSLPPHARSASQSTASVPTATTASTRTSRSRSRSRSTSQSRSSSHSHSPSSSPPTAASLRARIEAKKRSDAIDAQIRAEQKAAAQAAAALSSSASSSASSFLADPAPLHRLLLLGSADSGKSTVLKQMRILHDNGFSDTERAVFRARIWGNMLTSMKLLVGAASGFGLAFRLQGNETHAQRIASFQMSGERFPTAIRESLRSLWADPAIRTAYDRSSELPDFQDTVAHFFDSIDRCTQPTYVPTNDDILRARHKTFDISETLFNIGDARFLIYDVGGQRSLRQFWAPYLEGKLTVIIFVVALSSYDQVLAEDETSNRLDDALHLFGQVCTNKLLSDVAMVLFLNKVDLFQRKLPASSLRKFLPSYPTHLREDDVVSAGNFVKGLFVGKNKGRVTYTHFTTGTDTAHMSVIIGAVKDIVLTNSLKSVGLL